MATQLFTGQTTDVTSSTVTTNGSGQVNIITAQIRGELDGGSVQIFASPENSAGAFVAITNSSLDPAGGPVNFELAGEWYVAMVLGSASASTSVDGWMAVGIYGS